MHGAVAGTGAPAASGRCPAPVVRLSSVTGGRTFRALLPGRADANAQTIGVVVPRGPLTVLGTPTRVALRRAGDMFVGKVRGVRVVDARGDASGWTLATTINGVPAGRAVVCVQNVEAMARSIGGLRADASNGATAPGAQRTLLRAEPGAGAGAFDVTLTIAVDAEARNAERIVAGIRFDISPSDRRVSSAAAG